MDVDGVILKGVLKIMTLNNKGNYPEDDLFLIVIVLLSRVTLHLFNCHESLSSGQKMLSFVTSKREMKKVVECFGFIIFL